MREKGIKERLVRRCWELYRKTRIRIRAGEIVGKEFWTGKGVRQSYPLSLGLLIILIEDLEKTLRRDGWGKVTLKDGKVFLLAYADDIILLAEDEEGI